MRRDRSDEEILILKILLIIFVAILVTIITISKVSAPDVTRVEQETTFYEDPVELIRPTPVENPVENPVETIVENPVDNVDNFVEVPSFTDEELEILALVIYQEAGGDKCSDDTRRKVGSVFLNRVNSPQFPNTFQEVATQRRQYGTLYLTGLKWPNRASLDGEAHAVDRAYAIAEELLTNGSILPENVIWQSEFVQGDGIYCYQDEIYFCYSEVNK